MLYLFIGILYLDFELTKNVFHQSRIRKLVLKCLVYCDMNPQCLMPFKNVVLYSVLVTILFDRQAKQLVFDCFISGC